MTTEQKLEQIVDKLLVKTQDNLCEWKKGANTKFILRIPSFADIVLYWHQIIGGSDTISLEIVRGDTTIASIWKEKTESEASLVRLYNYVTTYHQNYVNEQLGKLITELNKLGAEKPF